MMWALSIFCLYRYWKNINEQREKRALLALVLAFGILTWKLLMLWKAIAPFFGWGFM